MRALGVWLEKTYRTLFIGLIILLPIIFIPKSWATIPHAKVGFLVIFVGLGIIAFVLARFFEGTLSLPKSWVVCAAVLLPTAYLASAIATGASRSSLFGTGIDTDTVAMMFFFASALVLSALAFRSRIELMRVQYALILGAGLVILFQLARLAFGTSFLGFGVLTGASSSVIGTWHDLGIFLGLAVFFAAALLANPSHLMSSVMKWLLRAVLVLGLLLLAVVNTFDVWVGLAVLSVCALVYLGMMWWKMPDRMNDIVAHIWPFVLVGLISLVFAIFGIAIHDRLPGSLNVAYVEVRPSWQGTLAIASQTLEGKNALFGSGPNTFVRQWGLYKPAGVNETAFWNADFAQGIGFIPTSIATVGLLAALAWIIFLLSLIYEGIKILRKDAPDTHPFIATLAAAVIFMWAMCVIYTPGIVLITFAFLLTGSLIGWGMQIGGVSSYTRMTSDTPKIGFVWSVLLFLVAMAALVVSFVVMRALISDMYVNKSITTYNSSQNLQASRALINKALSIDSGNDRAHRAALELGILHIVALSASTSPDVAKQRADLTAVVSAAIQNGLDAVSVDANNYQNWLALANIYQQLVGAQVAGAYENAQKAYQSAIKKNPTNPYFHLELAQLAAARNDLDGTEGELRQALALKPNYAEALFMLSQLEIARHNGPAALSAAQAAALAAPQEPVAWFQFGALLYQAGRYQDAVSALTQAVSLNGSYANAIYMLGASYAALNRTDDAITAMKRVLELNPGNTQVEQAITTLQNGTSTPAVTTKKTTKKK